MAAAMSSPDPAVRLAPVTSRKASSSDSGSTSGVNGLNSSITRTLASA